MSDSDVYTPHSNGSPFHSNGSLVHSNGCGGSRESPDPSQCPHSQPVHLNRLYDKLRDLSVLRLLPPGHREAWEMHLRTGEHPTSGFRFLHGREAIEITAATIEEAREIVKKRFPAVGGILIDFGSLNLGRQKPPPPPHTTRVGRAFAAIPSLFKEAFGHFAASAIPRAYDGRFLIFGKDFVFVSKAETNKQAIAEFRMAGFRGGGVLIGCGRWNIPVGRIASHYPPPTHYGGFGSHTFSGSNFGPVAPNPPPQMPPPVQSMDVQSSKTPRVFENDSKTGMICCLNIRPTNLPDDYRSFFAQNSLYDSGCTSTTVYGAEASRLWETDMIEFATTFGINGDLIPVVKVDRYICLCGLPPNYSTSPYYLVNINIPLISVPLLVSVFNVQNPHDQNTLAYWLLQRVDGLVDIQSGYNALNDWYHAGFPEPTSELKALLQAIGFKESFTFPYDALLGWDVFRNWILDGVENKVNQDGQIQMWGR